MDEITGNFEGRAYGLNGSFWARKDSNSPYNTPTGVTEPPIKYDYELHLANGDQAESNLVAP